MTYSKRIVCLANSRKFSGRCVAGVELLPAGFGAWVRPISDRVSEELSIEDRRYADGQDVRLLDIIDIQFIEPRPHACQSENHVIDDGYQWQRVGRKAAADLVAFASSEGPLWNDGQHSYSGENDRIRLDVADQLSSSLRLVAPRNLAISVGRGFKKRQVRAIFHLGVTRYCLTVTDPGVEMQFLAKPDGEYPFAGRTLVCVSLGEPFDGYRYKLAAAVIPLD
jgi:hypothetical protein